MPKHAPKGRIKGEAPMEILSPMDGLGYVPCTAMSKQSRQRCKRRPIPGGSVCVMHGGKIPAVKAKAEERLARLEAPAIETMAYLMQQRQTFPSTAYQAARDVLDRVRGKAIETVKQEHSGGVVIRHEQLG